MVQDLLLLLAMRHAYGPRLGGRALVRELAGPEDLRRRARENPQALTAEAWGRARQELLALRALGIRVLPAWELPARFREANPPLALFVRGETAVLGQKAVAIVGSRRAGVAGCRWAFRQAKDAASDWAIVSGGARGIDAAAHWGAMEGGRATVAYLGVAADRSYPASHRRMFAQILRRGGAIASEYPPGSRPLVHAHADRNRFIAAHGERLLIAEAAEHSGTLGTATWAHRLGRCIRVAPPEIGGQRAGLELLLAKGWARIADAC